MPSLSSRTAEPQLFTSGGFEIFDTLPGEPRVWRALLQEAVAAAQHADRQELAADSADEVRGGNPARRLFSTPGGAIQTALYNSDELLGFVARTVGMPIRPSGSHGSYSYYVRTGDYLGLHRDVHECDVAVITGLCDEGGSGESGVLRLYPTRIDEPLSAIRSTPDKDVIPVRLRPGQSIVLLGGYVPHATAPMAAGQKRIISVLCFRGNREYQNLA